MKQTLTIIALGLLATLTNARPLMRRDMKYVTETDVVMETAHVYQTVWVDADSPAATNAPQVVPDAFTTAAPSTSAAPVPAYSASKPRYKSTRVIFSTSYYTPPAASSTAAPTSVYAPPVPTPAYTPPAAPSTTAVPQLATTPAPSSSTSATTFTGDMTFYDVGEGSCGWTSTANEFVVAIPHGQMNNGPNPNTNPLCGKTVNISYGGKSTTAKVVDTCMGCADGALDMSDSLFAYFAPMSLGRVPGMTWSFAN